MIRVQLDLDKFIMESSPKSSPRILQRGYVTVDKCKHFATDYHSKLLLNHWGHRKSTHFAPSVPQNPQNFPRFFRQRFSEERRWLVRGKCHPRLVFVTFITYHSHKGKFAFSIFCRKSVYAVTYCFCRNRKRWRSMGSTKYAYSIV